MSEVLKKAEARPQALRLHYLDGMRGLAALYVVMYHAYLILDRRGLWAPLPAVVRFGLSWTRFGHISVAIFIVLSGYCIMLPVARNESGELRGGASGFLKRRAMRILPPYYAAMVISLALDSLSYLTANRVAHADGLAFIFSPRSILSHLFLVHNLNPDTAYTVNSPFWSVATEAQIYLFFPAMLLPLWRRFGNIPPLIIAFAIGLAPKFLFHNALNQACPWYLGLFALGMAGASISFSSRMLDLTLQTKAPWMAIAALGWIAVFFLLSTLKHVEADYWAIDVLLGVTTTSLLIACTRHLTSPRLSDTSVTLAVLDSKFATKIGAFSYSIYLLHDPILHISQFVMRKAHLSPMFEVIGFGFVIIPATVVVAYLFHLKFEKPFMSGPIAKRVPLTEK